MSTPQKIAALEELLTRVQANGARPRTRAVALAPSYEHQAPLLAQAVAAPEREPEEVDVEDVEFFDDEIIDLTVAAEAPVSAQPAEAALPALELSVSGPPDAPSEPPTDMEVDLTQAATPAVEAPISTETLRDAARIDIPVELEGDFSDVGASLVSSAPPAAADANLRSALRPSQPADDEQPASSRRAKALPASMSEALAEATADAQRNGHHKTPPPESGRQAASPPLQVPPASRVPELAPTRDSDFTQAEPDAGAAAIAAFESLTPEHATRTHISAEVVSVVGLARAFQPRTFVELLDATLRLGRED